MTQAKAKSGNRALLLPTVLLVAALLLVTTAGSALAGTGANSSGNGAKKGSGTTHAKCKKKPKGKGHSHAKAKCGKKKHRGGHAPVVPPPATPPVTTPPPTAPVVTPATTTLAIDPTSFDFGNVPHGGFGACLPDPDPDCPTHVFTVTNTGGATSGVPSASILEVHNPEIGGPAAFAVTANTCTAALAPGASCAITVKFAPNSNAGDEMYSSELGVTASPGTTVLASLTGMAS